MIHGRKWGFVYWNLSILHFLQFLIDMRVATLLLFFKFILYSLMFPLGFEAMEVTFVWRTSLLPTQTWLGSAASNNTCIFHFSGEFNVISVYQQMTFATRSSRSGRDVLVCFRIRPMRLLLPDVSKHSYTSASTCFHAVFPLTSVILAVSVIILSSHDGSGHRSVRLVAPLIKYT